MYEGKRKRKTARKRFSGKMNFIGDIDLFKIEVPEEGVLTLTTGRSKKRIRRGLRLSATLYNSDFDIVEKDLVGFNFRFRNRLSPGDYFLEISSPSKDALGKYKIKSFFTRAEDQL